MPSKSSISFYLPSKELKFNTSDAVVNALNTALPIYAKNNPGEMLTLAFADKTTYVLPINTPFRTDNVSRDCDSGELGEIFNKLTEQLNDGLKLYFDAENGLV